MKPIIEGDYLPDYKLVYDEDADLVTFVNRNTMPMDRDRNQADKHAVLQLLSQDVYEEVRHLAPGWDTHMLADTFAVWWVNTGKPLPRSADALFMKFCRTWQEKNGAP